jgi:hypothetical protein
MIASNCSACGRSGEGLRPLPQPDDGTPLRFSMAYVCEACVAPSVEALREIARRPVSGDTDAGTEVQRMLQLVAFLKANGLEIGETMMGGLAGTAGVQHGLLALLDSLERQLICSQCWSRGPESRIHVIPYFNNSIRRYVTSFRCDNCVDAALAETIARVRDLDGAREIDTLGDLLRSHGVAVSEWLRGEPLDRLRPVMVGVLASLRGAALKLRLRVGEGGAPMPAPRRCQ